MTIVFEQRDEAGAARVATRFVDAAEHYFRLAGDASDQQHLSQTPKEQSRKRR
jgi:hypothetical protein